MIVDDDIEIAVQVNGKVRGRARLSRTASESEARGAALADENVTKFLLGKPEKKLIYVPGRVLNFIVG
jgi:leucyl-tRNA synthetase